MPDLSDRLELAPGVELTSGCIVDQVTGVTYPANASAEELLRHDGSLAEMTSLLARSSGVDEAIVRDDVLRFAWTLNQHALVNILPAASRPRRWLQGVRLAARLAPFGRVPAGNVRRREVETSSGVLILGAAARLLYARALVYALGVTCLLGASTALISLGGSRAGAGIESAVAVAAVAIATAFAFLTHEAGHLVGLRGAPAALVLRRGRTSVVHRPLARRREMVVALAGPAAATFTGLVIAAAAYVESETAFAMAACPFCGHALSATVAARDGRAAVGLGRRRSYGNASSTRAVTA